MINGGTMDLTFEWTDGNSYRIRKEAFFADGITLPCGTCLQWENKVDPQLSIDGLVELPNIYQSSKPPAHLIARANNMPLAEKIG